MRTATIYAFDNSTWIKIAKYSYAIALEVLADPGFIVNLINQGFPADTTICVIDDGTGELIREVKNSTFKALEFRRTNKYYYLNIENGNILTWAEMLEEAAELYDYGDDLNPIQLTEYYILTDIEI